MSKQININFLFIEKLSLSLAPCDLVDQGDVGKMGQASERDKGVLFASFLVELRHHEGRNPKRKRLEHFAGLD